MKYEIEFEDQAIYEDFLEIKVLYNEMRLLDRFGDIVINFKEGNVNKIYQTIMVMKELRKDKKNKKSS